MKNIFKQLLLICLVITSVVAVGLFAACNNDKDKNENTTVTYTVLVENDEHSPVKGVSVNWNKGGTRYDAVTTGDDGKATMELAPDTYDITFVAATLPDGYTAPANIQVTKDKTTVTATLVKQFRYVVKLVNEDGTPFYHENVTIAICQLEGSCLTPSELKADGTWVYTGAEPGEYKVQIQLPEDIADLYTFEGSDAGLYYTGAHFSATETELTITISPVVKTEYTVTVLKPDDTPATGVYVNLATSTSSFTPVQTDADGKAVIGVPAFGKYSVTLNPPEGFAFDYGAYQTTEANHEITVKLLTLNTLELETEMTADEKTAFGSDFSTFEDCPLPFTYLFEYTFVLNETKYFAFAGAKTDNYIIYCKTAGAKITVCTGDNSDFTNGEQATVEANLAQGVAATKGKTVYFSIKANAGGPIEFVIAAPDPNPSSEVTLTGATTQQITVVSAEKYATVIFKPSQSGVYEISSEGNFDTRVEYSVSAFNFNKYDEDDDSGEGANFKLGGVQFKESEVGNSCLFRVYVKEGATFPATFNVKIVRTGDAEREVQYESEEVTPEQLGTEVYPAGDGLFTEIDLYEAPELVQDNNKIYHVGTVDGPVLVAKLSKSFRDGYGIFTSVNPMIREAIPYFVNFGEQTNEYLVTYYNYVSFLEAYTAKCNSDGVYPVNDEIRLMLERWAAASIKAHNLDLSYFGEVAEDNEWLIPCGYYYKTELIGEGTADSYYRMGYGIFEVEIPAGDPVYFAMLPGEYTVNVTCGAGITINTYDFEVTATDTGYTFDCESYMWSQAQFTVTNSGNSTVTVTFTVTKPQKEVNETELVLGENTVEISAENAFDGVMFTFIAETEGRYVISSASEDSLILADENTIYLGNPEEYITSIEGGFAITVEAMEAGQEFKVLLASAPMDGATYVVTVSKELEVGENEITANYNGTVFGFSTTEAGKYLIYAVDESDQCAIMYHSSFNGYTGDLVEGSFAFVVDCEEFVDYYFVFTCVYNMFSDTCNYTVNIVKLADVTLSVGENSVDGTYWGNVYAFTAEEDGTYTITSTDDNAGLLPGFDCPDCEIAGAVNITLEAEAGKTYFFIFTVQADASTYTVSVTKVEAE